MASKPKTFDAVIVSTKSLDNSAAGNPRWRVFLRGGEVLTTQSDASCNYGINNPEIIGQPVTLTLTASGRISHITPVVKGGK